MIYAFLHYLVDQITLKLFEILDCNIIIMNFVVQIGTFLLDVGHLGYSWIFHFLTLFHAIFWGNKFSFFNNFKQHIHKTKCLVYKSVFPIIV